MTPVKANQGIGSSTTDVEDITVELRNTSTYTVVATTTAALKTDGTAICTFASAPSGSFYLVINGRNIVQTWSATPITVGTTPASYDFTTAINKAYGSNMAQVETGVYAIYSGDINQDEIIDYTDYSIWEEDYNNFSFGVFVTDLNGDGIVDYTDYSVWEQNYNNFIYAITPP